MKEAPTPLYSTTHFTGGGLKRFKSTDNLTPADIGAATNNHTHKTLVDSYSSSMLAGLAPAYHTASGREVLANVGVWTDGPNGAKILATADWRLLTEHFILTEHHLLIETMNGSDPTVDGPLFISFLSQVPSQNLTGNSVSDLYTLLNKLNILNVWVTAVRFGSIYGGNFVKIGGNSSALTVVGLTDDGNTAYTNVQQVTHYSTRGFSHSN